MLYDSAIEISSPSSLKAGMIQGSERVVWSSVLAVTWARFNAPVSIRRAKNSLTMSRGGGASKG